MYHESAGLQRSKQANSKIHSAASSAIQLEKDDEVELDSSQALEKTIEQASREDQIPSSSDI